MRKLLYVALIIFFMIVSFGYAELPDTVKNQSRKYVVEPESWNEFDKSGQVKFLQVQSTASASEAGSGAKLDGSRGERLIEIKVDPAVQESIVEWTLKNKGESTVWVITAGGLKADFPISIEGGATTTLRSALSHDRYTYIVVDNEGGGKTSLDIKTKCGEIDARTTRGKSMLIIWF